MSWKTAPPDPYGLRAGLTFREETPPMMMAMAADAAGGDATPAVKDLLLDPWQDLLGTHPLEAALVLIPVGLAFLLYGFRLYKWLVILAFAGLGALAGLAMAGHLEFNGLAGAIPGAVILGLIAWPLHRAAWGVLGGAVFGLAASGILAMCSVQAQVPVVIVTMVAFTAGLVLTMVLMRPLIIVITSVMGAAFLSEGALRLLALWPEVGDGVMASLTTRPYVPIAIILVLALVGSLMQVADTGKKKPRRKSDAEE